MSKSLRGPFHVISVYYKYGESSYETFETAEELKAHIKKCMKEEPVRDKDVKIPTGNSSITTWIEAFIKYGSAVISEQSGYGCRYVLAGGKLVECDGLMNIK